MNDCISSNEPILSVVIPCFNQGEYLLDALSSIQSCSEKVYEIIIVNDGSTDKLTINLMKYLEEQGYLTIEQENQGVSVARNNGIEKAQGRYILALDADNKIRPDYITKAIEVLDSNPDVGVVYGKPEWFGEIQRSWDVPEKFDLNKLILGNYIDTCAVFRRSLWRDCGGYDPNMLVGLEDWDFWLSAIEKGWKFHYIPEVLFDYRVRSGSRVTKCSLTENRGRLMEYICLKHPQLYVTRFPKMIRDREEQIGDLCDRISNLESQYSGLLAQSQSELEQTRNTLKQSQSELHQTHDTLVRSQSELEQTHWTLEKSQSELEQTRNTLEQSQSELEQTRDTLVRSQSELEQTRNRLTQSQSELQQTLAQANSTIEWMETSKFWKLRLAWLKLRQKLKFEPSAPVAIPVAIPPRLEENIAEIAPIQEDSYFYWREQHVPRRSDLTKLAQTIEIFPYKPLISIIMPVYDTPETFLREAIDSVINQIYPHWELCIADDASPQPYIRQLLEEYQAQDNRIKVKFRDTNGHISHSSNSALEIATGDFIALLDHDDLLTPDALYEVVLTIGRYPDADMIYSDEDKIDEQGQLKDPFFKPDWCPDSFLSRMYTGHLGVYRRSLISEINGFRPGFEGSQDYDLVLRVTEKTKNIFHIPKILYHWRIHNGSVASGCEVKPYAYQAAEKALAEALIRRQEPGSVIGIPGYLGHYCIRYDLSSRPSVSIIIPTRDLSADLDRCLKSIFTKSTYPNYEVLVIDNNSIEASTVEVLSKWERTEPNRFRSLPYAIPFNFSKLNNYAVGKTHSEFLLFLNNDTEVITADWLDAMVEQVQRPQIGAVGSRLLYPDGTLQHAGVIAGLGGVAGHGHKNFPGDACGYFAQIQIINNYSAVTAACLMCRRDVFLEVGGFEENLAVAFNDVDFCFKILEKGYRNIYLPHVMLYHYESKSRGCDDTPDKRARFAQEVTYMKHKWKSLIANDPCYSPHLTKDRADYSLNV